MHDSLIKIKVTQLLKRITFLTLVCISVIFSQKDDVRVTSFLVYGPLKVINPAVSSDRETLIKSIFSDGDNIEPVVNLLNNEEKWDRMQATFPEKSSRTDNAIYYAAFWLEAKGFATGNLKVSSRLPFRIYLENGNSLFNLDPPDEDTTSTRSVNTNVSLETGRHLFIVKMFTLADAMGDRELKVTFSPDQGSESRVSATVSRIDYTSFQRLLDDPKIQDVSVSKDGNYAAVTVSKRNIPEETNDWKTLIFDIKSGELIKETNVSGFNWVTGDKYSYVVYGNKGTSLYITSVKSGVTQTVVEAVDNLAVSYFSKDGSKYFYMISKDEPEYNEGFKKHRGIPDRIPGYRTKYKTVLYDLNTGLSSLLTDFNDGFILSSVSRDNNKLLFYRSGFDAATRPYEYADYFLYDLKTGSLDSLFRIFGGGMTSFTKDGDKILISGGPSVFNGIGATTPADVIPNDYNTLLFSFDLKTKTPECLTKEFDPAISSYYLNDETGDIYLLTTDKSYFTLWKRDKTGEFSEVKSPVKSIEELAFDPRFNYAVVAGSDPDYPGRAFVIDLNSGKSKLLFDPNEPYYRNIVRSKYEEFSFQTDKGRNIDCTIFFPPDYNQEKKYPCIVNYYGGTTPVSNTFEGRYPKNIWAANGYIVFILQPSGAIGYGQQFSAYHVNDWGETVAQEIIQGTKEMLKRYPSVNPEKLGCIGASYGGFMTMSLVTKTDIFAAAISHAGISDLTEYWGVGYWGVSYSAGATANSFPWNRKDIYIDKSPVFFADKVNTPILLLHGNSDTNVPPGGSEIFYSALKMLGKEAEFIEVDKQDHHILEYNKRLKWSKTILAWFDKYLKDDPNWWNALYDNE